MANDTPQTLPANFFDKQKGSAPPQTLPADFFDKKEAKPAFVGEARSVRAAPKPLSKEWFQQKLTNFEGGATDALPAAGATVGGIAGAGAGVGAGSVPGAIGGAAIGGMGGEAAKQLLQRMFGFGGPSTSGEAAKDITKEGLIQGGVQAVSEGLPFAAPPMRRWATGQFERALAPTTKINKAITKDIVPGLLKRGERGSLESLEERAVSQAKVAKPKLDAAYGKVPASATQDSGTTIVKDLETLKGKYVVKGKVANPAAVDAITGVQEIVNQYGKDIDPASLRQLKHIFDEPVASRGGFAGGDLTTAYTLKAQKAAGNSIRKIMHQASPDVAALDKEVSFWLNVQRVTSQSGLRRTGQAGGLLKVLSPLAGSVGMAAGVAGHSTSMGIEAGVVATLTGLAAQAVRSPGWRTATAVLKDRFADALARGSVGDAMALSVRFGAAALEGKQSQPQSGPPTQ
jgi:hypothetical protein